MSVLYSVQDSFFFIFLGSEGSQLKLFQHTALLTSLICCDKEITITNSNVLEQNAIMGSKLAS